MSEEQMIYGAKEVRRETRLPFSSGEYKQPTGEEIAQVLRAAGMSGGQAARVVGVAPQRVREYIGGKASIPYSVWRLLLIHARFALDPARGELEAALLTGHLPERDHTVELAARTAEPLTTEALERFAALGGVASGRRGDHRVEVTMTVAAAGFPDAVLRAIARARDVAACEPIAAEVMIAEEFDRRLAAGEV